MSLKSLIALGVGALLLATAPRAESAYTVDCPFNVGGGDNITRGFYVDYPGKTLGTVTLSHKGSVAGERTITLTARLSTFNGTFIGLASVTRSVGTAHSKTVFDFGGIPIPPASRITFTQAVVSGDANLLFDVGAGPCAGVTETESTAAPLSTFRRNSVGLVVTGDPPSITSAMNVDCPFNPFTGDFVHRGFYVADYQGTTIDTVTLQHTTDTPGAKTIQLVARAGTYGGPILGVASVSRNITAANTPSVFNFANVPVRAGTTIAFVQTVTSGSGNVFYDTGYGPCPNVVETFETVAPLDTFKQDSAGVKITGRVASASGIPVVEYFHTGFGHYFMTADPDEIAGLDGGAYGGVFVRTGQQFLARDGPVPGTVPVCRFFTVTFAPKSSHFYTADPVECEGVKHNPDWQYEKIAFWIAVPTGALCGGLNEVYRAYNNGMTGAPNHRFTINPELYDDFVTNRGWAPEGVRFCAIPPV